MRRSNSAGVSTSVITSLAVCAVSSRGYLPSADFTPKNSPGFTKSLVSTMSPFSTFVEVRTTLPSLRM